MHIANARMHVRFIWHTVQRDNFEGSNFRRCGTLSSFFFFVFLFSRIARPCTRTHAMLPMWKGSLFVNFSRQQILRFRTDPQKTAKINTLENFPLYGICTYGHVTLHFEFQRVILQVQYSLSSSIIHSCCQADN